MSQTIYIAKGVSFTTSGLSHQDKVVKLIGALKCDSDEANLILNDVESDKEIVFSKEGVNNFTAFGIKCSRLETSSDKTNRLKKEEEEKIRKENVKTKEKLADKWLETLSEEQQGYVQILGWKNYVGPVG